MRALRARFGIRSLVASSTLVWVARGVRKGLGTHGGIAGGVALVNPLWAFAHIHEFLTNSRAREQTVEAFGEKNENGLRHTIL